MSSPTSSSSNSSNSNSSNNIRRNPVNLRRNAVTYLANPGNNTPASRKSKKGALSSKGKINIGKYFLFALVIIVILTLALYLIHLFKVAHIPFFEKDKENE